MKIKIIKILFQNKWMTYANLRRDNFTLDHIMYVGMNSHFFVQFLSKKNEDENNIFPHNQWKSYFLLEMNVNQCV